MPSKYWKHISLPECVTDASEGSKSRIKLPHAVSPSAGLFHYWCNISVKTMQSTSEQDGGHEIFHFY